MSTSAHSAMLTQRATKAGCCVTLGRWRRSWRRAVRWAMIGPAATAAAGPAREGRREEYELLVETIYEGYLLHYGVPRVISRPRPTSACSPATACMRSAWRSWWRSGTPGRGRARGHDHALARWRRPPMSRHWPMPCGRLERARSDGDQTMLTGTPSSWRSPAPPRRSRQCAQALRLLDVALNQRASILFVSVSDKHEQHKSKYTLDRQMPGAFEGETVTRRRFMTVGWPSSRGYRRRLVPAARAWFRGRADLQKLAASLGKRRPGRTCSRTPTMSLSSSR